MCSPLKRKFISKLYKIRHFLINLLRYFFNIFSKIFLRKFSTTKFRRISFAYLCFSIPSCLAKFRVNESQDEGTLSTPAARDFGYSGIEHEDEVYSVRQLAARDSGADFVKSERSLLAPVTTTGAIGPTSDSDCQAVLNDDDEKRIFAKESAVDDESRSDDRPLAVTASIFRSANGRADDASLKQPQEKTSVRIPKESPNEPIDESLKENDEPAAADRQDCCRPAFTRTPFILQVRLTFERSSNWRVS